MIGVYKESRYEQRFGRRPPGQILLVFERDGPRMVGVAKTVTVTVDGRPASLDDLRPGDRVEFAEEPARALKAWRTPFSQVGTS